MTTKMRRFYFQIPAANVIECIWAHSLTDAKAKAAAISARNKAKK